jgi:hypothetical protein
MATYPAPIVLTAEDAGCYVDGWWGQYAVAHMVQRAEELGYDDHEIISLATRKLASMGPSTDPGLTDDEDEALTEASDSVETWLNDNVAPAGYLFGWEDGEFFLWSDEQWNRADGQPQED